MNDETKIELATDLLRKVGHGGVTEGAIELILDAFRAVEAAGAATTKRASKSATNE